MAQNLVSLYNLALSAVGSTERISAPTEASFAAETCELWFPIVRDMVIGSARWPSTRGTKRLALAQERDENEDWVPTDPSPGWRFAYTSPPNMVRPWFLSTFAQFTTGINDSDIPIIETNEDQAILIYSKRTTNLQSWDPSLFLAISYALGAHIATPLSGKNARVTMLIREARDLAEAVNVAAANEGNEVLDSLPAALQARGYGGGQPLTRYLYPLDSIRKATGAPLE